LVSARIIETGRNKPVHAELSHVAERHRWAGRVLRFDHAGSLPTSTAARYINGEHPKRRRERVGRPRLNRAARRCDGASEGHHSLASDV